MLAASFHVSGVCQRMDLRSGALSGAAAPLHQMALVWRPGERRARNSIQLATSSVRPRLGRSVVRLALCSSSVQLWVTVTQYGTGNIEGTGQSLARATSFHNPRCLGWVLFVFVRFGTHSPCARGRW